MLLFLSFFLTIISSIWIIKIFLSNWFLAVIVIFASLVLVLEYKKNSRMKLGILLGLFLVLLFFQLVTTQIESLTNLDNDEQRIQKIRIKEYPPTYIQIFNKALWIRVAEPFETNSYLIGLSRIEKNIFENLDINQYFYAGHPRERVGVVEFEKFPFILMPFFIVGFFIISYKKEKRAYLSYFVIPILVLSFFGNKNLLGPFILFPFFTLSISLGIWMALGKLISQKSALKNLGFVLLIMLYILVFAQAYIYEFN